MLYHFSRGLRVLRQLIFQLCDAPLGVEQSLTGVREDLVLLRELALGLVRAASGDLAKMFVLWMIQQQK